MSPRFPRVTGKAMLSFLKKKGFEVVRIRGSHYVLKHTLKPLTTVIPIHGNELLGIGLTRKILQDTDILPEEFIDFFSK